MCGVFRNKKQSHIILFFEVFSFGLCYCDEKYFFECISTPVPVLRQSHERHSAGILFSATFLLTYLYSSNCSSCFSYSALQMSNMLDFGVLDHKVL